MKLFKQSIRIYLLFIVIGFLPLNIISQNHPIDVLYYSRNMISHGMLIKDKSPQYVDEDPGLPGGENIMKDFFEANLVYPTVLKKNSFKQNSVLLKFIVSSEGMIQDVSVVTGIDSIFNSEAIRVLKLLSKMSPGKKNGKPVHTQTVYSVIFDKVEFTPPKAIKMPSFPGGMEGMSRFLGNNMRYPVEAQSKGIQGRVTLRFTVGTSGKIEDIEIIESLSHDCDAEAVRVVKAMPDWEPAKMEGKPVKVIYTLPLIFRFKAEESIPVPSQPSSLKKI